MKCFFIPRIVVVTSGMALLAGCGQSGPLYLPGQHTPYGPPNYSILHPPARGDTDTSKKTDTKKKEEGSSKQNNSATLPSPQQS